MERIRHRITLPSRASVVKLFPVSDTHLCSPEADEAEVRRTVELIRTTKDAYWGHLGDITDCILPGDPRWNLRAIDLKKATDEGGKLILSDLASWQIEKADEIFWPIAHKCLFLQEGNHEQALYRHYSTHLIRQLMKRWKARGIEVPYGSQEAFIRLDFAHGHETNTKYIFSEHGATGGGTKGNSVNNFNRRLAQMDADIYWKGHVHQRLIWHEETLSWGARRLTHRQRVMVLTGCYLKSRGEGGEPAYAERAGYGPNTIGGTVTLVRPSTGEVQAMHIEAYRMMAGR